MNIQRYIFFFVLGLILAAWGYRELSYRNEVKVAKSDLAECTKEINAILSAPVQIDTIFDTITKKVPQIVYIKATDSIKDTIYQDQYLRTYLDSIVNDEIKITYGIATKGWLETLDLSYDIYKKTIVRDKIVYRYIPQKVTPYWNINASIQSGINRQQWQGSLLASYKGVGGHYTYDLTHNTHLIGVVLKLK